MEAAQQLPLKVNSRLYSPVAALAMTAQVAQIIYKFFTLTP
jgi:hypothetical protein